MKLVLLDGDPALGSARAGGPDLPSDDYHSLGEFSYFSDTPPDLVVERALGARIVLTNKVRLGAEEMRHLPDLKLISVIATGVNVVDLVAAKAHGITVCNVPGYSTASTAQHTIALILEATNHVGSHAREVRGGHWESSKAFSYFREPLSELEGKTLGVVGYGAIGQRVAQIARALGMNVLVHTRTIRDDALVSFVDKETLLKQSDVVCLHCPLTKETEAYINNDALALMKPSTILVNAARGPVIDEGAVASALNTGKLSYFCADVLVQEPPSGDSPLLIAKHSIITPHVAWATVEARARLSQITVENVRKFQAGTPQNVVV